MSIIYNNQVVAGKYTQQVVADADTVNAGIIKLATEEQVIEGVDNTTAITPFYLAQKQDKISAGDGIVIDNNEISCTVNPDGQTIVRKDNGTMQCIGQLTKSNTLKFDWEGTQAEYNVAYLNGIIQPDWYCYITDDEEFVDYGDIANQSLSNLKAEGEARFIAKANTDLDNLSSVGQGKLDAKADKATTLNGYGITDGLNKNQITNCLLEVPQNIKLELTDGALTLKAGSELTYGDGRTIVIENDIVQTGKVNATLNGLILIHEPGSKGFGVYIQGANATSGTTPPTIATGTVDYIWFDTNTNQMKISHDTQATWKEIPLPIGVVDITPNTYTALKQVFNGMGYIGSTVWVDKGVKALAPNGRNEDGTLKNIEVVFDKVKTATLTYGNQDYYIGFDGYKNILFLATHITTYLEDENLTLDHITGIHQPWALVGRMKGDVNNVIYNFQPKQPFRAVDYNDKSEITGWGMSSNKYVDLTLGASGTRYTAPANGYILIRKFSNAIAQHLTGWNKSGIGDTKVSSIASQALWVWFPVKNGEVFTITYTSAGATELFKFIYAQGEL